MINPTIMGPAAGMVVGVICYAAYVGWALRKGVGVVFGGSDVFGALAVAAFVGGFLGYKSVVWLGLVAS